MGINDCELLSTSINFGVEDFTDAIHLPISIDGDVCFGNGRPLQSSYS